MFYLTPFILWRRKYGKGPLRWQKRKSAAAIIWDAPFD